MESCEFAEEDLAALLSAPEPFASAREGAPRSPGLYAVHAGADVWGSLGLGEPPDARPLYVGKAEDSLTKRIVDTHFYGGRTGSSTIRRSFAALLRGQLGLRGMPRNPENPGYFSNYGLSPEHDRLLTEWMRHNLELAVWRKPRDCPVLLKDIEEDVLAELQPPLNLKDVNTTWKAKVMAARKKMAEEAERSAARP